nr:MAG: protein of unknown function DUF4969 [Bacteriophage sp.]
MKRKNVIISALVLAIALTGCSGKKVDYNMEGKVKSKCEKN